MSKKDAEKKIKETNLTISNNEISCFEKLVKEKVLFFLHYKFFFIIKLSYVKRTVSFCRTRCNFCCEESFSKACK